MIERLLIAAALLALLVGLTYLARALWARRKRALVARLRANGAAKGQPGARVLYFSTPYCVSCREQQEPTLQQLESLATKPLRIERVNPLESPDLAKEYQVLTVPTTAVFDDDGRLIEINYGYASLALLARQLRLDLPEAASARYEI